MNKLTREEIEEAIRKINEQDQKNKYLIEIIKKVDPQDLENERFNNMSEDEKRLLRR